MRFRGVGFRNAAAVTSQKPTSMRALRMGLLPRLKCEVEESEKKLRRSVERSRKVRPTTVQRSRLSFSRHGEPGLDECSIRWPVARYWRGHLNRLLGDGVLENQRIGMKRNPGTAIRGEE